MTLFKRAWLSVTKKKAKTAILFLTVLILSIGVSAAIAATQAILNAELNLRRNLPAIATIVQDEALIVEHTELYGEPQGFEWIATEMIESIGKLQQVRAFDYAIISYDFYSSQLSISRSLAPYTELDLPEEGLLSMLEPFQPFFQEDFENFRLKGVFRPEVLDIETGIIELLEGRTFTADEMGVEPTFVAIISEVFAVENDLSLDDVFTLYHVFLDDEDQMAIGESASLEIIGIFSPTVQMNQDASWLDIFNHIHLNQLIYVPMAVAKFPAYSFFELNPESRVNFPGFMYQDVLFSLYDPLDLEAFNEKAAQMIPNYWLMDDLTNVFDHMESSMEALRSLASFILGGVSIASLTILGILITLFLYDRQHEMGIYLSLGERRIKIVIQMLIEIVLTALVAIVIALFVGNLIASRLSTEILRTELVRQAEENPHHLSMVPFNDLNFMGHGVELTHEEMLAAYSVSLDYSTIIIFISASVLMIILSTVLPIIYLFGLKTKDILMKASIG